MVADIMLEEKWFAFCSVKNEPFKGWNRGLSGDVDENVVLGIQCFGTVNWHDGELIVSLVFSI